MILAAAAWASFNVELTFELAPDESAPLLSLFFTEIPVSHAHGQRSMLTFSRQQDDIRQYS